MPRPNQPPSCALRALLLALLWWPAPQPVSAAAARPAGQRAAPVPWRVDEVRRGMKGHGLTVMQGTKVETFQAEILGVLKNTSPGRDLVLARLSGLGLEKTGVIAGMSGSPVYVEGRLLGAVAYAWAYGKEPIAGITPFVQMQGFVESFERQGAAAPGRPVRVGLREPLRLGDRDFTSVAVAQGPADVPEGEMGLVPLRTPVSASGFTPGALRLLAEHGRGSGLLPVAGGAATARVADEEKGVELEPGGPLAVCLIRGDFDLSGIGTVTHIEGPRVYGWGHPFMSMGACELPLMTGIVHTVYPRQTVSFKMGSPLREVGVVNADVSTCIAGSLGPKASMVPLRTAVSLTRDSTRTFQVEIVRQRALFPTLVFTALSNAIDMEGELPEEMTATMRLRIELEGHAPIVISDTYSGFSGGRAPQALYAPTAMMLNQLLNNSLQEVRVRRIDCETQILSGRRSAEIEGVELDSEVYAPGETVTARVLMKPHKGPRFRVPVKLALPADLPEGSYTATACDEPTSARASVRANPVLFNPARIEDTLAALAAQTAAKRTAVVLRLPIGAGGVAVNGKALPDLPRSMVQILAGSSRTNPALVAQPLGKALVGRTNTDWVVQGSETVSFRVTRNRRVLRPTDE